MSAQPPLDLSPLEQVTARLREALDAHAATPDNLFILDSVIKRFELTYELSFRFLRRYMIEVVSSSNPQMEDLTFAGVVRRGHREGLLLHGWPDWATFKEARNDTVHSYREAKAREVAAEAARFLPEAEYLVCRLKEKQP